MRDEVESVLERRLDKQKVGYLLLLPSKNIYTVSPCI